jgi:hypothetical protein
MVRWGKFKAQSGARPTKSYARQFRLSPAADSGKTPPRR